MTFKNLLRRLFSAPPVASVPLPPVQPSMPQGVITFDVAFERLIGYEGGYVNHPDDPGGETN